MPSEKNKMLKLNQHKKSEKMPDAIYVDIKCLVKKMIHMFLQQQK